MRTSMIIYYLVTHEVKKIEETYIHRARYKGSPNWKCTLSIQST